jgi:hypothetical protein
VWLVDPVDVPEAIERARSLGEPAAVLQLLDRHGRGCAAVAERLGVAEALVTALRWTGGQAHVGVKRCLRVAAGAYP